MPGYGLNRCFVANVSEPIFLQLQFFRSKSNIIQHVKKIGPWGPGLIWYLATKYQMSMHQQNVIMYTTENGGGDFQTWKDDIFLDFMFK